MDATRFHFGRTGFNEALSRSIAGSYNDVRPPSWPSPRTLLEPFLRNRVQNAA